MPMCGNPFCPDCGFLRGVKPHQAEYIKQQVLEKVLQIIKKKQKYVDDICMGGDQWLDHIEDDVIRLKNEETFEIYSPICPKNRI
jgi:hypothetical protein